MLCVSASKSGASKADEAFITTFDTSMEAERYHYRLCIGFT